MCPFYMTRPRSHSEGGKEPDYEPRQPGSGVGALVPGVTHLSSLQKDGLGNGLWGM